MRPRLPWVLGAMVVLVGTAFAVWRLAVRDTTTPVSGSEVVEDAVADLPSEAPTEGMASESQAVADAAFVVGDAPGDPGLYVYTTEGFEEIDALGGARHDYPPETFLSIQPAGCGTIVRWTALEERWDQLELCPVDDGLSAAAYGAYHQWFGQSDLQEFSCGPLEAVAVPAVAAGTWTYECNTDALTETWTVAVIGAETVQVAGEDVASVHVRVTSTLTGESTGSSQTDTWYLAGTPLVIHRVATRSSVNESLVGDVSYTERYEITLDSLVPQGARAGE